jgi:PKD repeat protein
LKSKKQNIDIGKLFKNKLDNAEIVPDVSVSKILMRKLAIREFLHFNPVKFNIYYFGGLLVAAISAAIMFSAGSTQSDNSTELINSQKQSRTEITENLTTHEEHVVKNESDRLVGETDESIKSKVEIKQKESIIKNPTRIDEKRKDNFIHQAVIKDSFGKNELFAESSVDNALQGSHKYEELMFESSATEGCAPLKIHFYNRIPDGDSCLWTFGDGGSSNNRDAEWIFDVEGEYKVVFKAFFSNGLPLTYSTIITVHPKPSARFEISPEKVIIPDDEIQFLNYSTDAVKYAWNFGDGNTSELFEPTHRYTKFEKYNVRLVVTSEYGCMDSLIVQNAFSGSEYFIDFPNAFIPNPEGSSGGLFSSKSDETSQVFHPGCYGVSEYHLKIFSKLGMLIFDSSDINLGWDGYFKGQLCNPGVYIWKVRGKFSNGEPFTRMGDVTLLSNAGY